MNQLDKYSTLDIKPWFDLNVETIGLYKPDLSKVSVSSLKKQLLRFVKLFSNLGIETLRFSDKSYANYRTKTICLDTKVLQSLYPVAERVKIMLGLFLHEVGHFKFTFIESYNHIGSFECELHKQVFNILEDRRIEHLMCNCYPGYFEYLEASRKDLVARLQFECDYDKVSWTDYVTLKALYPGIEREGVLTSLETLLSLKDEELLTKLKVLLVEKPLTLEDTYKLSKKVYDLLASQDDVYSNVSTEQRLDDVYGSPLLKAFKDAKFKTELTAIISTGGSTKSEFKPKEVTSDSSIPEVAYEVKPASISRKRDLDNAPLFAKKLKFVKNFFYSRLSGDNEIFEQTEGEIDEDELYQAPFTRNLFIETLPKPSSEIEMGVLLDLSASMSDLPMGQAVNIVAALIEAFGKDHRVRLNVYGHSADWDEKVCIMVPIWNDTTKLSLSDISGIAPIAENYDGFAIQYMGSTFTRKVNNKVLVVVGDGEPSARSYRDLSAQKHTRESVNLLKSRGIKVVSVAVGSDFDQSSMFENIIPYSPESGEHLTKWLVKELKGIAEQV